MTTNIGNLPISLLLKETNHLSATALAVFFSLAYSPWHLRPFAALLADAVPLLGTHRRAYVTIFTAIAAATWLLIAVSNSQNWLLAMLWTNNLCLVVSAASLGGILVALSRAQNRAGLVGSTRSIALNIADLVGSPLGGFLAGLPLLFTSITGALTLGTVSVLSTQIQEPKTVTQPHSLTKGLKELVTSKGIWISMALVTLVMIAPGLGTPLLYYQRDVLKFSPQTLGFLGIAGSLGSLAGGIVYSFLSKNLSIRTLLFGGIVAHVLSGLGYLLYKEITTAALVTAASGLFGTLTVASLLQLTTQFAPRRLEALALALVLTAFELAGTSSNLAGSFLYDQFHLGFRDLALWNAGTSAVALLAVPLVPTIKSIPSDNGLTGGLR